VIALLLSDVVTLPVPNEPPPVALKIFPAGYLCAQLKQQWHPSQRREIVFAPFPDLAVKRLGCHTPHGRPPHGRRVHVTLGLPRKGDA
jgi:hypothetical protein